ncbi:MAG TPA: hypothetical protein VGB63_12985 [Pedobacter sp.]|jgi:hypothetical protein
MKNKTDRLKDRKFKSQNEVLESLNTFFSKKERIEAVDRLFINTNKAIWNGKEQQTG